ncbi:MAG: hypothetical protein JKY98_03325 [Gammaproteobacteria bacterium]|nr:hypothetical protein [Gammaproteobacteria bacterium]
MLKLIQTLIQIMLIPAILVLGFVVQAEVLDENKDADSWLLEISHQLDILGIDVIHNLNHRELARGKIERPRLGRFPDLAPGQYPTSRDLLAWEQEFTDGDINGVALLVREDTPNRVSTVYDDFHAAWLDSEVSQRVFISFNSANNTDAEGLSAVLKESGFGVLAFDRDASAELPGRLYATAGLRMALDSSAARRYRSEVSEFDYLGERVRRNSNSIFSLGPGRERRITRGEPSVFRKHSLGDEYEASTIEEIIVPGGIALGEVAQLPAGLDNLIYRDEKIWFQDINGTRWNLPAEDIASLKALYDFVQRSETINSDAIVDIDAEGLVKISFEFRNTDIGYHLMEMDTEPFKFVRNLSVTKSVIIDTSVKFQKQPGTENLSYSTLYEIRFLSADTMRIAQTRVALEYEYEEANSALRHSYSWGRDLKALDENLDYDGLGRGTASLARYAAWAALFRSVHEGETRFLDGRYEFMKVDKSGRETPRRF